jgi:hypothetical protein
MEIVGRFTVKDQWNQNCALQCYRASELLKNQLSAAQYSILDELHERISAKNPANVLAFWEKLYQYRERSARRMLRGTENPVVMSMEDARVMVDEFKSNQLWHDLTLKQQQSRGWRSTVTTLFHIKSGWVHAAKAIMQYGLPRFHMPLEADDATQYINALGRYTDDMAIWLMNFAKGLQAYKETLDYKQHCESSRRALNERNNKRRIDALLAATEYVGIASPLPGYAIEYYLPGYA